MTTLPSEVELGLEFVRRQLQPHTHHPSLQESLALETLSLEQQRRLLRLLDWWVPLHPVHVAPDRIMERLTWLVQRPEQRPAYVALLEELNPKKIRSHELSSKSKTLAGWAYQAGLRGDRTFSQRMLYLVDTGNRHFYLELMIQGAVIGRQREYVKWLLSTPEHLDAVILRNHNFRRWLMLSALLTGDREMVQYAVHQEAQVEVSMLEFVPPERDDLKEYLVAQYGKGSRAFYLEWLLESLKAAPEKVLGRQQLLRWQQAMEPSPTLTEKIMLLRDSWYYGANREVLSFLWAALPIPDRERAVLLRWCQRHFPKSTPETDGHYRKRLTPAVEFLLQHGLDLQLCLYHATLWPNQQAVKLLVGRLGRDEIEPVLRALAHSDYCRRYKQLALLWQVLVEAGFYPAPSDPKWELDRVSDD